MNLIQRLFPPKPLPPATLIPVANASAYTKQYVRAYRKSCKLVYEGFYESEMLALRKYGLRVLQDKQEGGTWHPWFLVAGTEYIGILEIHTYESPVGGNIYYAISPDHQGKGYGTEILKQALPICRDLGYERIHLIVSKDNRCQDYSQRIIAKNGGVFEREDRWKYHYWIDLVQELQT